MEEGLPPVSWPPLRGPHVIGSSRHCHGSLLLFLLEFLQSLHVHVLPCTPASACDIPQSRRGQHQGTLAIGEAAHRVFDLLRQHPITTIPNATAQLDLTPPTVRKAVENLETAGIVREITGKQRDRIYVYDRYVKILDQGTEPLRG